MYNEHSSSTGNDPFFEGQASQAPQAHAGVIVRSNDPERAAERAALEAQSRAQEQPEEQSPGTAYGANYYSTDSYPLSLPAYNVPLFFSEFAQFNNMDFRLRSLRQVLDSTSADTLASGLDILAYAAMSHFHGNHPGTSRQQGSEGGYSNYSTNYQANYEGQPYQGDMPSTSGLQEQNPRANQSASRQYSVPESYGGYSGQQRYGMQPTRQHQYIAPGRLVGRPPFTRPTYNPRQQIPPSQQNYPKPQHSNYHARQQFPGSQQNSPSPHQSTYNARQQIASSQQNNPSPQQSNPFSPPMNPRSVESSNPATPLSMGQPSSVNSEWSAPSPLFERTRNYSQTSGSTPMRKPSTYSRQSSFRGGRSRNPSTASCSSLPPDPAPSQYQNVLNRPQGINVPPTVITPQGECGPSGVDPLLNRIGGPINSPAYFIPGQPDYSAYGVMPPMAPKRGGRPPKEFEVLDMEDEEYDKKQKRRQRNKEAAARCRQRRLELMQSLQDQVDKLKDDNRRKESMIQGLKQQMEELVRFLHNHDCKLSREEREDHLNIPQIVPQSTQLQNIPPSSQSTSNASSMSSSGSMHPSGALQPSQNHLNPPMMARFDQQPQQHSQQPHHMRSNNEQHDERKRPLPAADDAFSKYSSVLEKIPKREPTLAEYNSPLNIQRPKQLQMPPSSGDSSIPIVTPSNGITPYQPPTFNMSFSQFTANPVGDLLNGPTGITPVTSNPIHTVFPTSTEASLPPTEGSSDLRNL